MKVEFSVMKNDLLAVNEFASKDESRYGLLGVNFEWTESKELIMTATDGKTLATLWCSPEWRNPHSPASFYTAENNPAEYNPAEYRPVSWTIQVPKLTGKSDRVLIEVYDDKVAYFHSGGVRATGKIIEATFPDWRMVVPSTGYSARRFTVNPYLLDKVMKAAKLLKKGDIALRMRTHVPNASRSEDDSPISCTIAGVPYFLALIMPLGDDYELPYQQPSWAVPPAPPPNYLGEGI